MAVAGGSKSALSLGQRLWNSLSAWAIRNAGYQKYGKLDVWSNPIFIARKLSL